MPIHSPSLVCKLFFLGCSAYLAAWSTLRFDPSYGFNGSCKWLWWILRRIPFPFQESAPGEVVTGLLSRERLTSTDTAGPHLDELRKIHPTPESDGHHYWYKGWVQQLLELPEHCFSWHLIHCDCPCRPRITSILFFLICKEHCPQAQSHEQTNPQILFLWVCSCHSAGSISRPIQYLFRSNRERETSQYFEQGRFDIKNYLIWIG